MRANVTPLTHGLSPATSFRMKVLHVISGDLWAGAEVQASTLLGALTRQPGIEVAAALMNEGELARHLRALGISVSVFPESELSAAALVSALRRLMKSWRPDVVHTHRTKENILACIANLLAGNAASVRTAHGADEIAPGAGLHGMRHRLLRALDRFCGNHLQHRIISVSEELSTRLALHFPRDRIVTVENGIDAAAVRARIAPIPFRADDPGGVHVGIVGRMVPVKRVDLFLEMARHLPEAEPARAWRFHVFGDGPLLASLRTRASALGIDGKTTFYGHRDDIVACLAGLDVLVICSDHEGLPMTLLEAAAVGTPVAAHAVGGMTRVIEECRAGLAVTEHTPEGYARAVRELTKRSRPAGYIASRYDADHNAREIAGVYRAALAAAG